MMKKILDFNNFSIQNKNESILGTSLSILGVFLVGKLFLKILEFFLKRETKKLEKARDELKKQKNEYEIRTKCLKNFIYDVENILEHIGNLEVVEINDEYYSDFSPELSKESLGFTLNKNNKVLSLKSKSYDDVELTLSDNIFDKLIKIIKIKPIDKMSNKEIDRLIDLKTKTYKDKIDKSEKSIDSMSEDEINKLIDLKTKK